MFKYLVITIGFLTAHVASAQKNLKVHVEVNRIVIDNSNQQARFDFSKVCEVDTTIKFQDMRETIANNGMPDSLPNNCAFEYLGSKQTLSLWAGAGAYAQQAQYSVAVDRFSIQGVVKIGNETLTIWGTFKKNDLDGVQLTVDTPQRSVDPRGLRKESLRVTFNFYR